MRLTMHGHSCVRVGHGGGTLVVDPGVFSDRAALDGADAVLITHQHDDHLDEALVRAAAQTRPGLEIWGPPAVAAQLADLGPRVHAVRPGTEFAAAGIKVRVLGDLHAPVHASLPRVENNAYLFESRVLHPGDSLTVPDEPVTHLLVPAAAPWVKVGELADYVNEAAPEHALLIHDALLSPAGLALHQRVLSGLTGAPDKRSLQAWAPGTEIDPDAAGAAS